MAWRFPQSTTQNPTGISLGDIDSVFVASQVYIATEQLWGIYATGSNQQALIYGTVASPLSALYFGTDSDVDHDQTITVKAGGHVQSIDGAAVLMYGYSAKLVNEGLISSLNERGVYISNKSLTTTSTITNSGTIEGGTYGIEHGPFATETLIVNNTGTIRGVTASYFSGDPIADGFGSDIVNNKGTMIGDVFLGLGTDTYVGRGGRLTGTVLGGDGIDSLYGGIDNDRFDGGAGADLLDGGAGADTMKGGGGSDTYHIDNSGDIVDESVAGSDGSDTVRSSNLSINLGFSSVFKGNIEQAVLGGSANLNLTGNGLTNYLQGNSGANVINGGAGSDTLVGLGGNDTFRFANSLGFANIDTITDYNPAQDRIELDNAYFMALPNGFLYGSAFVANTTGLAADASDRIIYETDTGKLFYDSNGSAAGGTYQQFAQLSAGLPMTAGEFFVT